MEQVDDELMTLAIEKTVTLLIKRSIESDLDLARVAKSKEFREDVISAAIEGDESLSEKL